MSDYTHAIVFSWSGPLCAYDTQWLQVHDWINSQIQILQPRQEYRVIRPVDIDNSGRSIILAGVAEWDSETVATWIKHWLEQKFDLQNVRFEFQHEEKI